MLGADRAHRPWHHGGDQRAARAQGREGRPADHRGPPRRARDARGAEGRPLRPAPAAARAAGAARAAVWRARAHARRRPHRDARSTRRRSTTRSTALREAGVELGRGLLPARLARRPARAADRRGAARGAARGARLAVLRGAAADQGVRAGLHHGRERLCRPGARRLSRPAGDAPARGGLCRPDPDHAVARRRRDDRRQRAPGRGCGALGPGGRRRRRSPRERPARPAATSCCSTWAAPAPTSRWWRTAGRRSPRTESWPASGSGCRRWTS